MYNQEKKADAGKDRWELLPINQIQKVVKVLTDGAAKYGDNGWRSVDSPHDRFYAAMMRHLYAWRTGDKIDKESGFNHMIHVICNAIFLAEFDEADKNWFSESVKKFNERIKQFNPDEWTRAEDIKPIKAVDEDDKKDYHCRDCINCKKHHMIMKASVPEGKIYQACTAVSAHWCDAIGKEIPDTDVKLTNYCPDFEEIKHE